MLRCSPVDITYECCRLAQYGAADTMLSWTNMTNTLKHTIALALLHPLSSTLADRLSCQALFARHSILECYIQSWRTCSDLQVKAQAVCCITQQCLWCFATGSWSLAIAGCSSGVYHNHFTGTSSRTIYQATAFAAAATANKPNMLSISRNRRTVKLLMQN